MRLAVLLLFGWMISATAFAQRQYGVSDSTFHPLNQDTTLVAARHVLYRLTTSGLAVQNDFTMMNPDYYLRDFDILNRTTWYALVGSRYIGNETLLYKTADAGQTWLVDTSFYPAARFSGFFQNYNSVNQVQVLGRDTLVLFVGYYDSGIVYSVNGGANWQPWFSNLIVHYQGLIPCRDSYFLYSRNGDGFRAFMFRFPKRLLFSPDTGIAWSSFSHGSYHPPCYQGNTGACVYAAFDSLSFRSQYIYFQQKADSLCAGLIRIEEGLKPHLPQVAIAPNPAHGNLRIRLLNVGRASPYRLCNSLGQPVLQGSISTTTAALDVSGLPNGLYSLQIETGKRMLTQKVVLE